MNKISAIASCFQLPGKAESLVRLEEGNVNDTYLVTSPAGSASRRFILQKINPEVFHDPGAIVNNMMAITGHLKLSITNQPVTESRRGWEIPEIVPCRNGQAFHTDKSGHAWRMITYIENSRTLQTLSTPGQAEELGFALGRFHNALAELDPVVLTDTLPGFHITPLYLEAYDQIPRKSRQSYQAETRTCSTFIEKRRQLVSDLESAKSEHLIKTRVIHGDPKINNFLFDDISDHVIGMIDLDTVKPGLIQYDIGDCLRSCCNPAGEETLDLDEVDFNLDFAEGFFRGYTTSAGSIIDAYERDRFFSGIRLMTFELGLRFFTDFLRGDLYFKTSSEAHNLHRALVQFRLTEIIEKQEQQLTRIIRDFF